MKKKNISSGIKELNELIRNKIKTANNENLILMLNTLTERESKILKLKYGLFGNKKYSSKEIAELFKLSSTRIWQIEIKALWKLRHPPRSRKLKSFTEDL